VGGLQEKALLENQLHRDELALVGLDRDLKEARFYALQSRIRPHFLFNALNTVARSALLEGAAETEQLTHRLAALMRYSLGTGQAFVTIAEELDIVREYLSFQGIRFGSRLRWQIRAEPEVTDAPIPRFTLQPLVENAVLHGIEPLIAGGQVIVSVKALGGSVKLTVADTGAGMDAATLTRVRAAINGQQEGGDLGVGTASLESRLGYRYREGIRTALYSRPGRGTLLVIVIPRGGLDHDR
jgi:sensor histidine kinase YesM